MFAGKPDPRLTPGRWGNRPDMSSAIEIDRALATITATMNDQKLESFDPGRVQEIVTQSLGGEQRLTVDLGGGVHDETGSRVGAIRRDPGGEWIAERQNDAAERSDTAIPSAAPENRLRRLVNKITKRGS